MSKSHSVDSIDIELFIQTFLDIIERQYGVEIEWSLRKKNQQKEYTAEDMQKDFLTVKEAQARLKIGRNTIFNLIKNDLEFPVVRIGEKKLVVVGHMLPAWAEKKHAEQRGNQQSEKSDSSGL